MQKIICSKCGIEFQWSEALNDMACPNCWRRSIIYSKEWHRRHAEKEGNVLDYPVLRTVIARKIIHGDEASRNEGKMMKAELDGILSKFRAAQQGVQRTAQLALGCGLLVGFWIGWLAFGW